MEFIISKNLLISAFLNIAGIAFIFLVVIDFFMLMMKDENKSKVLRKVLKIVKVVMMLFIILILVFMISELSSDYDLLSIRNIILLVIFMVISCAYIIVSFISMKKKESIKLKKALLIISCIALIFTFASRIIIRNTYSEAEYEKYYEYKNGDHAYIESFIEREEYA